MKLTPTNSITEYLIHLNVFILFTLTNISSLNASSSEIIDFIKNPEENEKLLNNKPIEVIKKYLKKPQYFMPHYRSVQPIIQPINKIENTHQMNATSVITYINGSIRTNNNSKSSTIPSALSNKRQKIDQDLFQLENPIQTAPNFSKDVKSRLLFLPELYNINHSKIKMLEGPIINRLDNYAYLYDPILLFLKYLLFYRINITAFFKFSQNSKKLLNRKDKSHFKKSCIEFAIQLAAENKEKVVVKIGSFQDVVAKHSSIKNSENTADKALDYYFINKKNPIIYYNTVYIAALIIKLRKTGFSRFFNFLKQSLGSHFSTAKYYYMFDDLFKSLYKINLVFNETLSQDIQNHLHDINAFEVRFCDCSMDIKQHFLFHWVFCWTTYFSNNSNFPRFYLKENMIWNDITNYNREFFIQSILLLHIVHEEHKKCSSLDLLLPNIFKLKKTINGLLFENKGNSKDSIYKRTIFTLLQTANHNYSFDYKFLKAKNNSLKIYTPQENEILSNDLIPALHSFLNVVFNLVTLVCENPINLE